MNEGDVREIAVVKRDQVTQGESSGAMTRQGAISADTVGSEGIFMGLSRLPPGMRSTSHYHTNCESSLYVSSGQGRFLSGPRLDRTSPIEPGDFIFVPPNAPHAVANDGDVDLVFIVARSAQRELVEEYDPEHQAREKPRDTPFSSPLLLDRCKTCRVVIRGPLAGLSRLRGIRPYGKNPQLCNRCEKRIHGAEDRVVTVLFADIRGYTERTAHTANEDLLRTLRRFFNEASPIVYDHYGVVDQFLGDGMVVLFNVPAPRTTHSEDAIKAALAIQERLRDAPFGVGIGIETGMALAGHIGVGQAVDFTCVGEPVNLAARLQAIAGPGEIVLGPTAARKCAELIEIRALAAAPEVTEVKGLGPMHVVRITTPTARPRVA